MSKEGDNLLGVSGGAFDEELPKGKCSGRIQMGNASVSFLHEGGQIDLPLEGVEMSLGGASDRVLFFKHPSRPGTAFHTTDHSILSHAVFESNPNLAEQKRDVSRKKLKIKGVLFGVVGAFVLLIVGLTLAKGPLVNLAVDKMPVEWEVKMGEAVFKSIGDSQEVLDAPELIKELELLTDPLLEGINDAKYPFQFHIVEDETLNAFAIPGGHVVLHSGLLLKAESPEEIAGVLAHEIAHVTRRHSIRNMANAIGTYVLVQMLLGDASGIIGMVGDNATFLIGRKYSRDYERDADDIGWDYLLEARINPKGMVSFFEKLQEEHEALTHVEEALSFISTHPATSERIEFLEGRYQDLSADDLDRFREIELNLESFQNRLRSTLKENTDSPILRR